MARTNVIMNTTAIAAITIIIPTTVSFITDFSNKAAITANTTNNKVAPKEFRSFLIEIPPFEKRGYWLIYLYINIKYKKRQ